jgi:hypothetical protein
MSRSCRQLVEIAAIACALAACEGGGAVGPAGAAGAAGSAATGQAGWGAAGMAPSSGSAGQAGTAPPGTDASAGAGGAQDAGAASDAAADRDAAAARDGAAGRDAAADVGAEAPSPADGASSGDGATPDGATPAVAEPACKWPTPTGEQKVGATIGVSKVYDGGMKRFVGDGPLGSSGQVEGQPPLFQLANGATLRNAILGNPAADGVHCAGACTLENVWWEDVGEDAATLSGSSAAQVMTIDGGGARHAADKVFQHNGAGTMVIQNFCVEDFGKLYRSCGNCKTQYPRHAVIRNVSVTLPGGALAGVNENYGDSASFSGVFLHGGNLTICQRYTGNNTGAEPVQTGSGADGTSCVYTKTDIVSR